MNIFINRKIKEQYFQIRDGYYMRKYGHFDILRAKVGLRIIRGCVFYAENYGSPPPPRYRDAENYSIQYCPSIDSRNNWVIKNVFYTFKWEGL